VSIDGTDCRVPNHGPAFSSHKFAKKGGVWYEVALCLQTGDIVWVNGPLPCGRIPDFTIFSSSLLHHLGENERVEADDGYIGEAPRYVKCPKSFVNLEETKFMRRRPNSCNNVTAINRRQSTSD
jgi:hypothetical protein